MPGISGIAVRTTADRDLSDVVRAMQERLANEPWHVSHSPCAASAGIIFGSVSLDHIPSTRMIARDRTTGSAIVLDGELFQAADLAHDLRGAEIELPQQQQA